MPLVRGDHLSPQLRAEVLGAYVHRWTHENMHAQRGYYGHACPACWQHCNHPPGSGGLVSDPEDPAFGTDPEWHHRHRPLVTDAEWLRTHAFYVTRRGRLDLRRRHAEPACLLAEGEEGVAV